MQDFKSTAQQPPFPANVAKEMQEKLIANIFGIGSSYIIRNIMQSDLIRDNDVINLDAQSEDETIDLQLTDEEFCALAKLAHTEDITFNQLIARILTERMKEITGDLSSGDDPTL